MCVLWAVHQSRKNNMGMNASFVGYMGKKDDGAPGKWCLFGIKRRFAVKVLFN
jgi:hypothetical protein